MACCSACESGEKQCVGKMEGPLAPGSMPKGALGFGPNEIPQNVSRFGQESGWTAYQAVVVSDESRNDGKIPQRMMMF